MENTQIDLINRCKNCYHITSVNIITAAMISKFSFYRIFKAGARQKGIRFRKWNIVCWVFALHNINTFELQDSVFSPDDFSGEIFCSWVLPKFRIMNSIIKNVMLLRKWTFSKLFSGFFNCPWLRVRPNEKFSNEEAND